MTLKASFKMCLECTGEMRIISFIYKQSVTKRLASVRDFEILTRLNLYEESKKQRAPPTAAHEYTERVETVPLMRVEAKTFAGK